MTTKKTASAVFFVVVYLIEWLSEESRGLEEEAEIYAEVPVVGG